MIEQHLFHLEVFRILAEDFVIMTNATDLEPRPRTVVKAKPIAACPWGTLRMRPSLWGHITVD